MKHNMKVRDLIDLLEAELLCGEDKLDHEVFSACGSDLMSDVLANVGDKTALLTGLTNSHVVRTAEMLDLSIIVFVRGKIPTDEILQMAVERGIAVLRCQHTLFNACGILYSNGLRGESRRYEQ
jgi:hypothetical protein